MGILRMGTVGIRFGSPSAMLPSASPHAHPPRRRDRRRGFAELLAVIARSLDRRGDMSSIRGAFEESLRRIVPVRSVHLREAAPRWPTPMDTGQQSEVIALEVPCLLYTSDAADDLLCVDLGGRRI